jgi:hypothetical protein
MKNDGARRIGARLLAVAALVALTACSATRLTDVRQEPGHAGGPFRQVAVFAFGTDDVTDRLTEDEFVLRLPATTRGVSGHGLVPIAEQGDAARVRDRLRAEGYDGVIVVWLAGSGEAGPDSSRAFGEAYAAAQQNAQRAGDARRGGTVRLRTRVYSVAADALVWSASSRPVAPDDLRETTAGIARVVMKRLQDAGFLTET